MRPVIALSDIHGQMLVFPALAKLREKYPDAPVVFGGDYQDSAHHHTGLAVAKHIKAMQAAEPDSIFVLQGNHDAAFVESMTGVNDYWLAAEGDDVIVEDVYADHPQQLPTSMDDVLNSFKQNNAILIGWMAALPLQVKIGKLLFVHAGLDLTLADPVAETSIEDKYWLREEYWYAGQKAPYWSHNPLPYAIVTGHSPTSIITGTYHGFPDRSTLRNRVASPRGILTVQYFSEYARFFIDGGNHGAPSHIFGNIGVFDADTGTLIDAIEN